MLDKCVCTWVITVVFCHEIGWGWGLVDSWLKIVKRNSRRIPRTQSGSECCSYFRE